MCAKQIDWYLRKPDGSEYGPVTTDQLQRWAVQCRIVAGNGVSADRETWKKVEDIPELEMDWMAHRPGGGEYGPFNIAATRELSDHNVLPEDAVLIHRKTKESTTVQDVLEGATQSTSEQEAPQEEEPPPPPTRNKKKPESQEKPEPKPPEPKEDPKPEEAPAAEKAEEAQSDSPALQKELEKFQGRLKRTQADLLQARKNLSTANAEREELTTGLTDERDEAISALTALQTKTEKQIRKAVSESEKHERSLVEATTELAEAQVEHEQTHAKLSRLESERSESEDKALQSMAELRKQTAFMKKNNATLQNELEAATNKAASRGRMLAIVLTILAAILGILLLVPRSCSQTPGETSVITPPDEISTKRQAAVVRPTEATEPSKNQNSVIPPKQPQTGELTPWPKFMIEGVKAGQDPNALTLRFDSGVFTRLTTPSEAAKKQLVAIADALNPSMKDFRLIVEGHTDDQPLKATATYDGNYALGLARAEAIRELLITMGKLPGHAVRATSSGEKNPPYPNNSQENRVRNRTVVLKLVRQ